MPIVNGLFYSGWGDPTTGLASDLLTGKTLNNEGGDNVVGTMPNNGPVGGTITQQAGKVIIPVGYTSGGQVEANIANLMAANIKQGATVGGMAGTFTADANAVAGDVLTGKTAYVQGGKVTGSMANRGAIIQTISTQGGQYTVPAGYHNGSGKVTASFANLVAANVRAGVNIGGVIGSLFNGGSLTGTIGTTVENLGNNIYRYIVPAIAATFTPSILLLKFTSSGRSEPQLYTPGSNFLSDSGSISCVCGIQFREGRRWEGSAISNPFTANGMSSFSFEHDHSGFYASPYYGTANYVLA